MLPSSSCPRKARTSSGQKDRTQSMLLQPGVDVIFWEWRSACACVFLRLLHDVPVILKEVENRLDAVHGLKPPAHAHSFPPVKGGETPLPDFLEDQVPVLVHVIFRQDGIGGLCMIEIIFPKAYRIRHGFPGDGQGILHHKKVMALVIIKTQSLVHLCLQNKYWNVTSIMSR